MSQELWQCLDHKKDNQTINFMAELYQNEQAYQVHAQSPQFNHYRKKAPTLIGSTIMHDLNAIFIATKSKRIELIGKSTVSIHLAKISIKEAKMQAFLRIVKDEMQISVDKEPDVQCLQE